MTRYGVTEDYEYNERHKRHRLLLWSGPFRDVCEGSALSVRGGYMVTPPYGDKFRVDCQSPRTDENYREVDAALDHALTLAEADALDRAADKWSWQAERLERDALGPLPGYRDDDAELAEASWREARKLRDTAAKLRAEVAP